MSRHALIIAWLTLALGAGTAVAAVAVKQGETAQKVDNLDARLTVTEEQVRSLMGVPAQLDAIGSRLDRMQQSLDKMNDYILNSKER